VSTTSTLNFRPATRGDLPAIVEMLADDPLGAQREHFADPLPPTYLQAFAAIEADANNELVVAEDAAGQVIGVLQLTCTPYITHQGGWRATIEGVRVHKSCRSGGVGRQLFEWAIGRARERGCHLVQLTTDKQRPDALRFYEQLGFVATHEGMKLKLARSS
jgi:GNAT superfamily N-acetyltransferase